MRKIIISMLLLFLIMAAIFFALNNAWFENQTFSMDTVIFQKAYGLNAKKAVMRGVNEINRIEHIMDRFSDDADVYRLNSQAGSGEFVDVAPEIVEVLGIAQRVSELSNGAFDVTVAPLTKLWDIKSSAPRVPAQEQIKEVLSLVDYKNIEIQNNSVRLIKKNQAVDLGAVAKGYAADNILEIFRQHKIKSAFVDLGGNIAVLGSRPDKKPWTIGIMNPIRPQATSHSDSNNIIGTVKVSDKSVVTSGGYQRYFEQDQIRYHHILDPATGYPSTAGLASVTIVTESSVYADALSTAAYVLGLDKGLALVESLENVGGIFVTDTKKIYVSEGLEFEFSGDEDFEYIKKG